MKEKRIKKTAKNCIDIVKLVFYVLMLLLPSVADYILKQAEALKDNIAGVLLICVPAIILSAVAVLYLPAVANLFSLFYLIFGSLLIKGVISDAGIKLENGADIIDVAIRVLPVLFVILFALYAVYIMASDSIAFTFDALKRREKRNYKATIRSINAYRVAERKGRATDTMLSDFSRKQRMMVDNHYNYKVSPKDRFVVALKKAVIGAILFSALSCALFIFSKHHWMISYLGEWFVCNAAFLAMDVAVFLRVRHGSMEEFRNQFVDNNPYFDF